MMIKRFARPALLFVGFVTLGGVSSGSAQQSTPDETVGRQSFERASADSTASSALAPTLPPTLPQWATAAEASFGIGLYANRLASDVPSDRVLAWRDTLRTAVAERTQLWLAQLNRSAVRGIQLDAMGELFVAAGDEAKAIAQFEQRLATPGLALTDRAYTYQLATFAFHDPDKPTRLAIALRYLDKLLALPTEEIGRWQFTTLSGIARQYDLRGQSREVITYAARAFALTPRMPFLDRDVVFRGPYVMYVDALAGTPGGRATIDALNAALFAITVPPVEFVAQDSGFVVLGQRWARTFAYDTAMTANLGKSAASIVAHRWFNVNRPTLSATEWTPVATSLKDGKIHLLEFGDRYCTYCMRALPAMDRLNRAYADRGVEVWFVTNTHGIWNTTFIDRPEEVDRLKDQYVVEERLTLPIAVWAGETVATEDDGMLPEESPNLKTYQVVSRPVFYLVDGRGFIRHISRGFGAPDETRLRVRIERLLQESAAPSR